MQYWYIYIYEVFRGRERERAFVHVFMYDLQGSCVYKNHACFVDECMFGIINKDHDATCVLVCCKGTLQVCFYIQFQFTMTFWCSERWILEPQIIKSTHHQSWLDVIECNSLAIASHIWVWQFFVTDPPEIYITCFNPDTQIYEPLSKPSVLVSTLHFQGVRFLKVAWQGEYDFEMTLRQLREILLIWPRFKEFVIVLQFWSRWPVKIYGSGSTKAWKPSSNLQWHGTRKK